MQTDRTSIAVHRDTLERIGEVGRFNESYEDVIRRLLDSNPSQNSVGGEV